MTETYRAPPIIEAIVELRFKTKFRPQDKGWIVKKMSALYDQRRETSDVDVEVTLLNATPSAKLGEVRTTHFFSSDQQTDVLRVEDAKISWSRLAPYESWTNFVARIKRDFSKLEKKVSLNTLDRIGVRYRNRLDIPESSDGLFYYEQYSAVNIGLPNLLDPHDFYRWTVVKNFPNKKQAAIINSEMAPAEIPRTMALFLDIDTFVTEELPVTVPQLHGTLEELRLLKNEIFEACITNKARESFQ
jgi:uncharacterized protein (TIGR04255 family)